MKWKTLGRPYSDRKHGSLRVLRKPGSGPTVSTRLFLVSGVAWRQLWATKNATLKWELRKVKKFCDYSMSVKLHEIRQVYVRLLGTNSFHVTKDERYITAG